MFEDVEVTVTQKGDIYKVSGADTLKIYRSLKQTPDEVRTLEISPMENGVFTFKKLAK